MSEDEPVAVDVSLIDAMMVLTVRERLELNDRTIRTALRLREAMRIADEDAETDAIQLLVPEEALRRRTSGPTRS
jgi:hypothetical protein